MNPQPEVRCGFGGRRLRKNNVKFSCLQIVTQSISHTFLKLLVTRLCLWTIQHKAYHHVSQRIITCHSRHWLNRNSNLFNKQERATEVDIIKHKFTNPSNSSAWFNLSWNHRQEKLTFRCRLQSMASNVVWHKQHLALSPPLHATTTRLSL